MNEEIMEKKGAWSRTALLAFGFGEEKEEFHFQQSIMDGDFLVCLRLDKEKRLWGQVIDAETGEDYSLFRSQAPLGAYASQIRQAYQELLVQVQETCFSALPFSHSQSNRLAQLIKEQWADLPDYPFAKLPTYGAFRHPANNKWYALVSQVPRNKLDGSGAQDLVEIVNLKVDSREIAELLSLSGLYPAYHMSKKTWVSVLLDGTVADEVLFALVEKSRFLVGPKSYKAEQGPDYWVIPANPTFYDIDSEFAENPIVYWPQKSTIQAGDFVAVYVTAPVQAIRYVCRVLQANVTNHGQSDIPTDKSVMQVELIATLPDTTFPIERMKELGVKAVRGPRRLTKEMIHVLTSEVSNLG